MFSKSAYLYDLIYTAAKKDYRAETEKLKGLIRGQNSNAKTILDAACGTGEHARHLSAYFRVDGLDLDPGLLAIARSKNPSGRYFEADMTAFHLDQYYDVVLCLFSAIGYVKNHDELKATLRNFSKHLNQNGLVIVEPWFEPDTFFPGTAHMNVASNDEYKVCRMAFSEVKNGASFMTMHYLVGSKAGVEHFTEDHTLRLFTRIEMLDAFAAAGLHADYTPDGLIGRGLYVATNRT